MKTNIQQVNGLGRGTWKVAKHIYQTNPRHFWTGCIPRMVVSTVQMGVGSTVFMYLLDWMKKFED